MSEKSFLVDPVLFRDGAFHLTRFIEAYNRLPEPDERWDGFAVGRWLDRRRQDRDAGRLTVDQMDQLAALEMHLDLHPRGPGTSA